MIEQGQKTNTIRFKVSSQNWSRQTVLLKKIEISIKRVKSYDIDPYMYKQLISDKVTKLSVERIVFTENNSGKIEYMQKQNKKICNFWSISCIIYRDGCKINDV